MNPALRVLAQVFAVDFGTVRALSCLGAGVVAGAIALGWASHRLEPTPVVPSRAVAA